MLIRDAVAVSQVVQSMRYLQRVMRDKIEPGSTMTDERFVDITLSEIDSEWINEALDILEFMIEDELDAEDVD